MTGNINAKSSPKGVEEEDERGRYLREWFGALSMVVLNDGKVPTFVRDS